MLCQACGFWSATGEEENGKTFWWCFSEAHKYFGRPNQKRLHFVADFAVKCLFRIIFMDKTKEKASRDPIYLETHELWFSWYTEAYDNSSKLCVTYTNNLLLFISKLKLSAFTQIFLIILYRVKLITKLKRNRICRTRHQATLQRPERELPQQLLQPLLHWRPHQERRTFRHLTFTFPIATPVADPLRISMSDRRVTAVPTSRTKTTMMTFSKILCLLHIPVSVHIHVVSWGLPGMRTDEVFVVLPLSHSKH